MKRNQQRNFWLGLSTVILLFVLIFGNRIIAKFKPTSPFLFLFDKKQIIKINVLNANKKIYLKNKNNQWFVIQDKVEFTADQERINTILDTLKALKKEDIVSNNKEKQFEFGINNIAIEFSTKDEGWKLYLGKNYSSTQLYVKTGDNEDIFLASDLSNILYPEDFRDLNLHLIDDENKLTQIELDDNVNKLILIKKKDKWYVEDKEAKKDRVDFLINDLKTLSANDITKEKQQLPEFSDFTITLKANKQNILKTFYKDETNSWVLMNNNNVAYVISSIYLNGLKKTEKDLVE
ncbi:hypothetical protein COW96_02625 [Candidatus Roizmanbacteria bacterium CG22_combo_CG10-13_8_21_14_all_33_16]|uniref:DUF4340 domain-containing protein n=1 Tax=Candidatus Roizmanbacteria bacterium CG22_combo_CG10-13_8_21_14_all_33_16 TaxID=1974859 RepID=A0A2H0C3B5_9BACT|nr:MAG: hypothetical protein COW96_02625 [Candidatus Roizmanbacteria bacterium CG22_combo_CG10-13_8_21_14_all_33_16]